MGPKLVLVRWIDAQADLGWMDKGEAKVDNPSVWSVGWVQENGKRGLILAGDICQDLSNNRRIEIPKGMVQEIIEIEVEERKESKVAPKKGKELPKKAPKKKVKK